MAATDPPGSNRITRRTLFAGSAAVAASTTLPSPAAAAAGPGGVAGALTSVTLKVNGQDRILRRDPRMTLLVAHDGLQYGYCTPGQICSAVAVANAIYNACEVRLRDYPMTLDKVMPALPLQA